MIPMNAAAATCIVTFNPAMLFIEDGTTPHMDVWIQVGGTAYTDEPFDVTFTVSEWVNVQIEAVVGHNGRYYRHWTMLQGLQCDWGWNKVGDIEVRLIAQTNEKLIFAMHCGGDTSTASVEPKYTRAGPAMDVYRTPVIRHPDAALIAMQTGTGEVSTDLIRTGDIEKLDTDGHTITFTPGFHMGHIGYNIRELAKMQERRPELTYWPLNDVGFRTALFHCYDQDSIVASIYGYTVTPVQSLVPPALGGWENTLVPKYAYNPGDPFTSPSGEASSCGYLKAAGYTFVDADSSGDVTSADYWECPNNDPVPKIVLWTPTYETAPTSAEHGARFVADLAEIGLAASGDNGDSGFYHEPAEFADYMDKVDEALFDAYMVFWSLGRFPDHLYDMCHSSQDVYYYPKRYNKPGIRDDEIDALVEIIKTSLNHAEKLQAAWDVQELLYDSTKDYAMAYMQLYSRIYFNGFNMDLRGIVNMPGYGSNNGWTESGLYWAEGLERYCGSDDPNTAYDEEGKTLLKWIWGEYPERLNPCYASTVYAWDILENTMDGLIGVNPYTLSDVPAMAESWYINETATGMNVTFVLRKDMFWQDGQCYNAHDAKFNWLFLRDNEIPRFTSTWEFIEDVIILDDYKVRVIVSTTSQFLLYDLAGSAAVLPPQVWTVWDGKPLADILAYDPSTDTDATGMGSWFGTDFGPSNRLFGTGPWVFDYYDNVGGVAQMHQFAGYFDVTSDVTDLKMELFYACGDVNRDGLVWADDRGQMGVRFGCMAANYIAPGIPPVDDACYDANVDINGDGIIDMGDISLANYFYGDQREYP
jgi:peptide/nickel transport system substrate-binding protein